MVGTSNQSVPEMATLEPGGAYLGFGLQYALLTPFVLELGVPVRWASIIWLGGPITGRGCCGSKTPNIDDPAVFRKIGTAFFYFQEGNEQEIRSS